MKDAIGKFALFCSGADLKILDDPQCEHERTKYKMIGMFVFLTAAFATLSGGYALHTGFKSVWLAAPIGALWGIFIFNLDRFIISTFRKPRIDPEMSLLPRLWLKTTEVAAAIPRLIFALFIAIVISSPLELKYFKPEIDAHLSEKYHESAKNIATNVQDEFPRLTEIEQKRKAMEKDIEDREAKCDQLREVSFGEAEGTSGTLIVGKGPVYREKLEEFNSSKQKLAEAKQQLQVYITEHAQELSLMKARRDEREKMMAQAEAARDGFLARLTALQELSVKSSAVASANFFITMLFMLLEINPILMKLLSKRGPYDESLDAKEHLVFLSQQQEISNRNDEVNTDIKLNTLKNQARIDMEEKLTRETMEDIENLAQADIEKAKEEIARDMVDKWKRKNRAKAAAGLSPEAQMSGD